MMSGKEIAVCVDGADAVSRTTRWIAEGGVVWITGLSGAGKTSVSRELVRQLSAHGVRTILLDGDDLLRALGATDAFDLASRRRRAFIYGRLCALFAGQGHLVICATIALFHAVHEWNRANVRNYLEVLLEAPLPELRRRNAKGLYGPAGDESRMVGAGLAAEFPRAPDLVVPNFGATTVVAAADRIKRVVLTEGVRQP
jgi:adenylylsulfate kinase